MDGIERMDNLVDIILQDYQLGRDIDRLEMLRKPDKDAVIDIIEKLRRIVFPGYSGIRITAAIIHGISFPYSLKIPC